MLCSDVGASGTAAIAELVASDLLRQTSSWLYRARFVFIYFSCRQRRCPRPVAACAAGPGLRPVGRCVTRSMSRGRSMPAGRTLQLSVSMEDSKPKKGHGRVHFKELVFGILPERARRGAKWTYMQGEYRYGMSGRGGVPSYARITCREASRALSKKKKADRSGKARTRKRKRLT